MNIKPNTGHLLRPEYQSGKVDGRMGRKNQSRFFRGAERDNYECGYREGKRLRNLDIEREGSRG